MKLRIHGSDGITTQFHGNAAHRSGGLPWGMRLQIAFLFPKPPSAMEEKLK